MCLICDTVLYYQVLESFKIMDYSLLMGIHNLDEAAKENLASTPAEKSATPVEKPLPSQVDTPTTPSGKK